MSQVKVPDIGDFTDVPIIEILVAVGDTISPEQPLVVLESDKATLEVPSPVSGMIQSIDVAIGDKISRGDVLLSLEESQNAETTQSIPVAPEPSVTQTAEEPPPALPTSHPNETPAAAAAHSPVLAPTQNTDSPIPAGPAVRRLARELGVDLQQLKGTGRRGRISAEDVRAAVQAVMSATQNGQPPISGSGLSLLPWPQEDFTQYGPIESQALSRIRKISGPNLHRNWVSIPHVTNHDDADITELEDFRQQLNQEWKTEGVKASPLAFIIKACAATLQAFPEFNASLDGDSIILKRYWHIGFAADTPEGLLVPVIRDVDKKGIREIADEMSTLSAQARAGKLSFNDMKGGSFSVSSLGGIGGSYFTPIINAPEVAILGVGRTQKRLQLQDGRTVERLYLPLSLSWDHRVVDGAAAGRFNAYLTSLLSDVRRLLL